MHRPPANEYDSFYAGYVDLVPENEILPALAGQEEDLRRLASSVDPERETFRYAAGKWSIREVVGHLCDAERVFGYRAFCISRGERAALPGFDEKEYLVEARYDLRTLSRLVDEWTTLRRSTLLAFEPLSNEDWLRRGTANESVVTVRALAWIVAGHFRHHMGILRERYGIERDS